MDLELQRRKILLKIAELRKQKLETLGSNKFDLQISSYDVELAGLSVAQAQRKLDATRLLSPIEGVVADITVTEGDQVNPFQTLDEAGVGRLVELCVKEGREANPDLEIGICGEHGGDPSSIDFCHRVGLDYVSCSPFRVPVARLAAAQATLRHASDDQRE